MSPLDGSAAWRLAMLEERGDPAWERMAGLAKGILDGQLPPAALTGEESETLRDLAAIALSAAERRRQEGQLPAGAEAGGRGEGVLRTDGRGGAHQLPTTLEEVQGGGSAEIPLPHGRGSEADRPRAASEMAAALSRLRHELGQPLTVIQGFSELICDQDLSREEIQEYAAEIFKQATHLGELLARTRG